MTRKKTIYLVMFLFLMFLAMPAAGQDLLWNPVVHGTIDGQYVYWTFQISTDLTADKWLWGDTTAAGMYVPEVPMEIIDVCLHGDPDSGDSCRVVIYDCDGGGGTGVNIAAFSDSLIGTTWMMCDDANTTGDISDTYGVITADEGMAINFDFIAGTPNSCTVMVIFKIRHKDYLE